MTLTIDPVTNGLSTHPQRWTMGDVSRTTDMDKFLSESDLDVLEYNARIGRYRVRLEVGDECSLSTVTELIKAGLNDRED